MEVEKFVVWVQLAQRMLDRNTKNNDIKGSEDSNLASEIMLRFVKNGSGPLLLGLELSVMKKGWNCVVTDRRVSVVKIVTASELACRSLCSDDAHGLRSKIVQCWIDKMT